MALLKRKSKTKNAKKTEAKASKIEVLSKKSYEVLEAPYISEKTALVGKYNQYVFRVALSASKPAIKRACYEIFGVKPVKVNLIKVKGKKKRFGAKFGKRKNWKKAVVIVAKDQKMDVLENV